MENVDQTQIGPLILCLITKTVKAREWNKDVAQNHGASSLLIIFMCI